MIHVAVIYRRYIEMILRGEKRVELRLSRNRIPPFGVARAGDTLFMKESGGPIRARAMISRIECFEGLTPDAVMALKGRFNHLVCGPDEAWAAKINSRFATFLWLGEVEETDEAPPFPRFTGNAWRVLNDEAASLPSRA